MVNQVVMRFKGCVEWEIKEPYTGPGIRQEMNCETSYSEQLPVVSLNRRKQ